MQQLSSRGYAGKEYYCVHVSGFEKTGDTEIKATAKQSLVLINVISNMSQAIIKVFSPIRNLISLHGPYI